MKKVSSGMASASILLLLVLFGLVSVKPNDQSCEDPDEAAAIKAFEELIEKQGLLDDLFKPEGLLGKGLTVGKIQVALFSEDRGENSIFSALINADTKRGRKDDDPGSLADLAYKVCLSLLRKKTSWAAAHSQSMWFSDEDAGKAEAKFNEWVIAEEIKFEKVIDNNAMEEMNTGGPTFVVVTLIVSIEGDSTKFDGAGLSLSGTQEVLTSIASNCIVDNGEVFWSPGDPKETLSAGGVIVDYPNLVTFLPMNTRSETQKK